MFGLLKYRSTLLDNIVYIISLSRKMKAECRPLYKKSDKYAICSVFCLCRVFISIIRKQGAVSQCRRLSW